jgi:hypothetical protein
MTRWFSLSLALAALLPSATACVDAPKVIQGHVARYDRVSKLLVIKDELPPAREVELSLAEAEVGAEPGVGERVRLAYHERGGRLVATRLANISRQAEIAGKPSGKH